MNQRILIKIYFCFIFVLISLLSFNYYCVCSPKKTKQEVSILGDDNNGQLWTTYVIDKLNLHLLKLQSDLEKYLENRYLYYLKIVGSIIDFNIDSPDSNLPKSIKTLLRISTIHAYLMIHQTALTGSAIQLLDRYFQSIKDKNYKLDDRQLRGVLMYLNIQIRSSTFDNKSEYLLEFAHLCSKYENTNRDKPDTDEMEKLIEYLKVKTHTSMLKVQESRDDFANSKIQLSLDLQQAIDFKLNYNLVQEFADNFYNRNGLTPIISGYLFMSNDNSFTSNIPRKFHYKKYFKTCKKAKEKDLFKSNSFDYFDPILPLELKEIKPLEKNKNDNLNNIADSYLKKLFHREIIVSALPDAVKESYTFHSLMVSLSEAGEFLKNNKNHNNNKKSNEIQSLMLDNIQEIVTEYQFLKSCLLDRLIKVAKSYIGYGDSEIQESKFIVPFDNKIFALRVQILFFAFYPVMVSQASDTIALLNNVLKEMSKLIDEESRREKKTSLKLSKIDVLKKLNSDMTMYKKKEDIKASVRMHRYEVELKEFRSASPESQSYYVAMNNNAIENVMSLYIEPAYHEMDYSYDFVRKLIFDYLLSDQVLTDLTVSNGKSIEGNVLFWIKINPKKS